MAKPIVEFEILGDTPLRCQAIGRDAWALAQLIQAGERGLTTLQNPAPRWSHYIFKLRRMGVLIETENEAHDGPYAGHHARYRLRSQIRVLNPATVEAA